MPNLPSALEAEAVSLDELARRLADRIDRRCVNVKDDLARTVYNELRDRATRLRLLVDVAKAEDGENVGAAIGSVPEC